MARRPAGRGAGAAGALRGLVALRAVVVLRVATAAAQQQQKQEPLEDGHCNAESGSAGCAEPRDQRARPPLPVLEKEGELRYPRYPGVKRERGARVWSRSELSLHNGTDESLPLLLCMVGEVYDVGTGPQYYAPPKGDYQGLSGRDASRAMAIGEFTGAGMSARIADLSLEELSEVMGWRKFYAEHKTYRFVGFLKGLYFDSQGVPTAEHDKVEQLHGLQTQVGEEVKALKNRFKACNSKSGNPQVSSGVELWCDDKYHGPDTAPVYVHYAAPGQDEKGYCACVPQPARETAEAEAEDQKQRPKPGKLLLRFADFPECVRGKSKCTRPRGAKNPK